MHRKITSLLLIVFISLSLIPYAHAQESYRWQVSDQHVVLDIDPSGTVHMTYEVNATIVKGVWNEVWIPVTVSNMQVEEAVDGSGNKHAFTVSDGQIKTQGWNLNPGDHVYLRINSNLPGFVYKSDKEGYDIVEFIPPWWDMYITDTQVKFYLPGKFITTTQQTPIPLKPATPASSPTPAPSEPRRSGVPGRSGTGRHWLLALNRRNSSTVLQPVRSGPLGRR